jgi:riboflavin kinase/FMN adenylyltransferase
MKVFYGLNESEMDTAVALGNFDGLHRGHQKVISLALAGAADGLAPTVLTFADSPKTVPGGGLLLPRKKKMELLEKMGVRQVYLLNFDSVRDMEPETFITEVLSGVCHAKKACCGFNFTFGRGGRAGSGDLAVLCSKHGIKTAVAGPVLDGGTPVSSTRIRHLISAGKVEEAARLLGRPFGYELPVLSGRKLGRQLGTPTINQAPPEEFALPKFGVYVTAVTAGGRRYCGVTNVGVKPTVGSSCILAETWMPRYSGPALYGAAVSVEFLKFLRPERKFPGLAELKEEIRRNGSQALEYFSDRFPNDSFV